MSLPSRGLDVQVPDACKKPRKRWPRWVPAFLLLLLVPAGGHLGKNALGPLEPDVCTALGVGPAGFGLLLSAVSFPSVFFPSLSGALYDHWSGSAVLLVAAVAVLIGQSLLLGSYVHHDFHLAVIANGLFGAGAGSLNSLQHATMASTLGEEWLGLCLGLSVCVTNLWRLMANLVLPTLQARFGLPGPLSLIIWICVLSLAAGVLLNCHNKAAPKHHSPTHEHMCSMDSLAEYDVPIEHHCVGSPHAHSSEVWMLWLLHTCLMASTMGFSNIGPSYLMQREGLHLTEISANQLLAASWRPGSLTGAAFGGCISDRFGRGRTAVVAGVGLVASFAALALPAVWPLVPPFAPLLVLGLAQGVLTTATLAWIPRVLCRSPGTGPGTAYGVLESLAALGEVVGNISIGAATARWGLVGGAMPLVLAISGCCYCLIAVLAWRCPETNELTSFGRRGRLSECREPLIAVV